MQISIIIGVILMLLGGESVSSDENLQSEYMVFWGDNPWTLLGITCSLIFLFGLSVYSVNRMIAGIIRKGGYVKKAGKIVTIWRFCAVFLAGIFSFLFGWGRLAEYITDIYMIKLIFWLLPFMVLVFLQLFWCYDLDVYCRKGRLPEEYTDNTEIWSRSSYMVYHLRHNLLGIVVPILLITFMVEVGEFIFRFISGYISDYQGISYIEGLITVASIGLAYFLAPLVLRYVWMTSPLPAGQQRNELEFFCDKMKLKYSEILLWRTYRMVGNAAVTGLLPFLRYVIVSDKLLENLSGEQLCAVFGHEAGHIRHKHMPLLLLAVMGIITVLGIIVESVLVYVPEEWPLWSEQIIGYCIGLIALLAGFTVFGYISRNFEREADVYGACSVDEFRAGADGKLSSIGSAIMSSSLQRLAFINGISVNARSWRHSSLSSRMELLFNLAVQPGMLLQFRRKLCFIKSGIVLVFIICIIVLILW